LSQPGLRYNVRPSVKNHPKPLPTVPAVPSPPAERERRSEGWSRLIQIDPRSLAIFRIVIGLLLLSDLAIRASDLAAMYSDDGIFPRAEMVRRVSTPWNWSIHFASGAPESQAALFGLAALLALALVAGWETRMATIGSWILLVSLHHRVPAIQSGADILFRMLLFWGMFLPLGQVWSLDHWLKRKRGEVTPAAFAGVRSIATAAILLQMGVMYLFSAYFKTNADWFQGGVIRGSLAHDFYAKPLGTYLLQFPAALQAMTWGVFLLEWIGPLLLFWPKNNPRTRIIGAALLAAMHIGIALTMHVDLFSPVALAGLSLFLPAQFWGRAHELLPAARTGRIRSPLELAGQALCALALAYVIIVNLSTLSRTATVKPSFPRTGLALGQKWNMFDETPSKDGWYVALARLRDGSEVDLLRHGTPLTWDRPSFPASHYPNFRWRKLFREMAYEDHFGYQHFRAPTARFLCREWNRAKPPEKQIVEFTFVYCMETEDRAAQPGKMSITVRERLLHLDLRES
jgi:hypothetical protein